jgi:hypothetical protein
MLFTSANAQVFLDDKEPVQEELKTIDTIVTLEEDGTNINDMLNINNYIYDTIDQVEKKYIQQMYVSAPKPTDDIKVNLGVKKTFVDGSWADFLRLIDSTRRNYFVQFSAAWCGPCKMMEHVVFNKAPIIDILISYIDELLLVI